MTRQNRIGLGESAYFVVVAVYGVVFLLQPHIHLQDYAHWVYTGAILNGKLLGAALPHYLCRLYPVPNSLTTVLIAALSFVLPAATAAKLLIVVYLGSFAWIVMAINKQLHASGHVQRSLVILSTVIISSSFWNGYMNYQLGLLLFAGYYLIRLKGRDSLFLTALFGIAVFFAHAAVFAVFFIYVLCCHFSLKHLDRRLFALLPSAALAVWFVYEYCLREGAVGSMALSSPINDGVATFAMYKVYTFLKAGPFQNFILPNGESYLEGNNGLYYLCLGISAVFLGILFCTIAYRLYRKLTGKSKPDRDAVFFAIIFLSYLLFPPKLCNVVNIGERLMMIGLLFLLFRVAFNRRLLSILVVMALVFTAYNMAFLAGGERSGTRRLHSGEARISDSGRLSREFQSLYAGTEHKYLNHRIFDGADYYRAVEERDFTRGIFATGIFIYRGDAP